MSAFFTVQSLCARSSATLHAAAMTRIVEDTVPVLIIDGVCDCFKELFRSQHTASLHMTRRYQVAVDVECC